MENTATPFHRLLRSLWSRSSTLYGSCLALLLVAPLSAQEVAPVAKTTPVISSLDSCRNQPPQPSPPESPWKIPPRPDSEKAIVEPLEAMNRFTMCLYERGHEQVRDELDAVIVIRFSGATLFLDGVPVGTKRVIPATYHNLRYASHVPLAIYVSLAPIGNEPLSNETKTWIRQYIESIQMAQNSLDTLPFASDQLKRQRRLLSESVELLENFLRRGRGNHEALRSYARHVSIDLEQNTREAGRAQVDGLHQQMLAWRSQLTDTQWCNLRFVVRGFPQARSGFAATQYLAALVNDPGDGRGYLGESRWVVYREAAKESAQQWDPEFDLLATLELDERASRAIFIDPDRLTVDVAADGARERVAELDFSMLSRNMCDH